MNFHTWKQYEEWLQKTNSVIKVLLNETNFIYAHVSDREQWHVGKEKQVCFLFLYTLYICVVNHKQGDSLKCYCPLVFLNQK